MRKSFADRNTGETLESLGFLIGLPFKKIEPQ